MIVAIRFAASLTVGLFLSRNSLILSCAFAIFCSMSMSEATPVPEVIRYSLTGTILSAFLSITICPPAVARLSPAITTPSLQISPTKLVPLDKMFFFKSVSILESSEIISRIYVSSWNVLFKRFLVEHKFLVCVNIYKRGLCVGLNGI